MKILVTGAAGFIGYHLTERLIARGDSVTALDSINAYYDPDLKYARLARLGLNRDAIIEGESVSINKVFRFWKGNLSDSALLERIFNEDGPFDAVCNLAAQAGVRHSLENPHEYIESNISGFVNILEQCRRIGVGHLVYASSSSVYGLNDVMPFSTEHPVDHPTSLYGVTKRTNELMAHSYSHLFGIPTSGLRFFTVYGPWGRPDMALFLFTKAALEGNPIKVFNNGEMARDFTYIDDIVEGIVRVIDVGPIANPLDDLLSPGRARAPFRVFNIGNNSPVPLMDFIAALERHLGFEVKKEMLPMQPGDVPSTYADVSGLVEAVSYRPSTAVDVGVARFVDWYRAYFNV